MTLRGAAIQWFAALFMIGSGHVFAEAQQPSVPERVAELKAALAASQASLRQYEWMETTVTSLKGEEKSRKQQRCYYGADGVLQKVAVSASSAAVGWLRQRDTGTRSCKPSLFPQPSWRLQRLATSPRCSC